MKVLIKDAAGNRLIDYGGYMAVVNKQGKRVIRKDAQKFMKHYGFKTEARGKKLFMMRRKNMFGITEYKRA